jgi:hypothetical protein
MSELRTDMTATDQTASERRSGPERTCIVCMEGVYITKLESDATSGPGRLTRYGLQKREAGVLWHVESCSNCGHVLIFRRESKGLDQPDAP